MAHSDLVHSLLRGLDILKLISSRPEGMRLNEITQDTGLKKSTVHNLLRTLAAREFLVKDNLNRFSLGPAVLDMASSIKKNDTMENLSTMLLDFSRRFPQCTLTVSALRGNEIRCLLRISPDLPGLLQHPSDRFFMPYVSASAIALQSANPELAGELEKRFPFDEYGIGKWGTLKKFEQQKQQVLQDGFCCQNKKDSFAVAFIMPEAMVLGFSSPQIVKGFLEQCSAAAAEMRSFIWKK
jgi:DNA-binding IclR family transcriptional regulator